MGVVAVVCGCVCGFEVCFVAGLMVVLWGVR